jgi:molecular chaperone DnaK (HSP70)
VVDVGGGTTDLSLIAVLERDGNLELQRVAVGEHILLGGDNMDLALAYGVARKLASQGTQLDAWQTRALAHACRASQGALLSDPTWRRAGGGAQPRLEADRRQRSAPKSRAKS